MDGKQGTHVLTLVPEAQGYSDGCTLHISLEMVAIKKIVTSSSSGDQWLPFWWRTEVPFPYPTPYTHLLSLLSGGRGFKSMSSQRIWLGPNIFLAFFE